MGSAKPSRAVGRGGLRPGDDKWADSIVAIHAKTGAIAWAFQLVHHNLWDYDTASPPLLATLPHHDQKVPVVIQSNKTGFIYVLNRETGAPVFPVEERPVPQSDVPGEVTSPTQPIPVAPPSVIPQKLSPDDVWGLTPEDRETCRKWLSGMRSDGIFTPPGLQDTVASPGVIGGANWSGYAFDPRTNLLFVNTNNLPFRVRLIPSEKFMQESMKGGGEYGSQTGAPYGMFRAPLFSPGYVPCSPPPWGTLTAVDMAEGKIRWQVPLGSMQNFGVAHPMPVPPGSPSLGGPIVTAGDSKRETIRRNRRRWPCQNQRRTTGGCLSGFQVAVK
jgi:quinoprotein glucose dehydrogenase